MRLVLFALFFAPLSVFAADIASTSYVHGAVASIVGALGDKADVADLSPVAFSGDYNDLANKPDNSGTASIYEVRSNSISGATVGTSFSVMMDGFTFRATKQNQTNYWSVRIVNNSGETRSISTSWTQVYGGLQGVTKENLSFADGANHNPDGESGDLGYGKQDAGITYLFDHTNMHLYRWVVSVHVDKAVMAVGKLH